MDTNPRRTLRALAIAGIFLVTACDRAVTTSASSSPTVTVFETRAITSGASVPDGAGTAVLLRRPDGVVTCSAVPISPSLLLTSKQCARGASVAIHQQRQVSAEIQAVAAVDLAPESGDVVAGDLAVVTLTSPFASKTIDFVFPLLWATPSSNPAEAPFALSGGLSPQRTGAALTLEALSQSLAYRTGGATLQSEDTGSGVTHSFGGQRFLVGILSASDGQFPTRLFASSLYHQREWLYRILRLRGFAGSFPAFQVFAHHLPTFLGYLPVSPSRLGVFTGKTLSTDFDVAGNLYLAIPSGGFGARTTHVHMSSSRDGFSSLRASYDTGRTHAPDTVAIFGTLRGQIRPDLYLIERLANDSLRLSILSASSNYRTETGSAILPFAARSGARFEYRMSDWDRDGLPDVMGICVEGCGSGRIEVHVSTHASGFSGFSLQTATPLRAGGIVASVDVTDYDLDGIPDLVYFARERTGSRSTEVHVASGKSFYQTFLIQTGTVLSETPSLDFELLLRDIDQDGAKDLVLVARAGTASGKTEIHILNGK